MGFYLRYLRHWLAENIGQLPLLLALGVLFLLYLYHIWWVYRDAQYRYNKGLFWALIAALVPGGGYAFYLMYRVSPLVEYDLEEEELGLYGSPELSEYIRRKRAEERMLAYLRARRRMELYLSRLRERYLSRLLSVINFERQSRRLADFISRQSERFMPVARRVGSRAARAIRHAGWSTRGRLEFYRMIRELPTEDPTLEELIYEERLEEARKLAQDNLRIAEEQGDRRAINTYRHYLERLDELEERSRMG